ncbi:MAG: ABC transporter substrate-binding protein [Pyrobaculum sp.]
MPQKWIYIAIGAVILVAVLAVVFTSSKPQPPPTATAPQPPPSTQTPATSTATSTQAQTAAQTSACSGGVVGFVAPALIRVVKDAATKAGLGVDGIQSVGSVEGIRRIQGGAKPDVFASVDIELRPDAERTGAREIYSLGRFKLALVCRRAVELGDIPKIKLSLADPNKAPIGYRELAASWMLQQKYGVDLTGRYTALGVRYVYNGTLYIYVPSSLPNTDLTDVAPNLDATWSRLETGAVDCIYAYVPFLINKYVELKPLGKSTEYWELYEGRKGGASYNVYVFKPPYDFLNDPPIPVVLVLLDPSGRPAKTLKVGHFEAFVASYTERGDCVVNALKTMNLADYGFVRTTSS